MGQAHAPGGASDWRLTHEELSEYLGDVGIRGRY